MTSMELVGLNTKWFRYQNGLTREFISFEIEKMNKPLKNGYFFCQILYFYIA